MEPGILLRPNAGMNVPLTATFESGRLIVPLAVPPSSLAVLRRLAATPGHVVSRDALLDVLPGGSDDPHRVEVAVARLRESLRASGVDARLVRTVVKRGYLLAGRGLT